MKDMNTLGQNKHMTDLGMPFTIQFSKV